MACFEVLTRFPIVIYYGDYISKDNPHWVSQRWSERVEMAKAFAECVNRHGGDASVVVLPERGIYGNSHFAFMSKLIIMPIFLILIHQRAHWLYGNIHCFPLGQRNVQCWEIDLQVRA